MSGPNEEATTVDASQTSAANALDVNAAARLKQLDAREQSLTAREQAMKERERQVKDQAGALKEREAEVEAAKTKVQRDLADLAKRQKQVAETESSLEARSRDLAQREIEASEGFATKNREALGALTKAHASLRAEVERLQAELDAARLKGVEDLEKRLADERRTRTEALDAEIEADRKRHLAKLATEGAAQDAALSDQRARFAKEQQTALEEIERERVRLADLEAELRRGLGDLRWKEEDLAGYRAGIERSIEERARDQVASLERQLDALREDHRRDRDLVISLESQLAASRDLLARFGDDPAEIEKRIAQQAKKISDLEKELLRRPSASDKELLVTLQEQERAWADERDRLVRELTQLKAEQSRWLTGVADLEQQRERREVAERRLEVLAGEMEKYKADVDRMRALYERPEERAARVGAIEEPWRTDFKRAEGSTPKELDWLNGIVAACESSGMRFPKRLVQAFHTSLKAAELSPLTVLAGVSGTGKSELPRLYSRFGGLGFLSLAVQPNWDSPQSLFGFFNSVDNRFNATTVLRAMVQAQHERDHETYKHGLSDRLLLVLLDEMNLAHVEQYFSDLLSRLEQRRGESRDVTLDIDLGAGMPPYALRLGRNVLWVGTMNEDETTKALSDKVIDRSNLLYFPRPRELHSRTEVTLGAESPLLAESAWREWLQLRSPFTSDEVRPFKEGLQEINSRLEYVGRALGHRVWQSVEYYMANHPEVIDARARQDADALQRTLRRAYEDQLVLKVMPKLRGIETTGDSKRNCLDPIRKQLDSADMGLGLSDDFDIACRVGHGAFVWNSARYLENAE
ncbi:hypothetical protein HJC10_00025 [Corallococcus exiguus]|uniref:hypothetical protein n=1 Tax=Corallococcus exiguus TaxID=83462 RepID=UPI00147168C2|nr:hypothetical protein [Corallococcus exiguus]NNB92433.1 hypothetical protein [Corallococcus exiguus]NNC01251.1 hypothetical protein [Corallococcus exiguus]